MQESKFEISASVKFPDQLESFDEKVKPSFGLSVGTAISTEWFHRLGSGTCRFYGNQLEFQKRRNYANGNIDMRQYYPKLGTNGDVSLLNLSAKPLTTIPKLVDLVVNGMCDRGYSIEANAIDPVSQKNKQAYRKQIKDDMNSKEIIELSKEKFGIDIGSMPTDKLPETDDELNLHLQMEWKPSCELSAQIGIASVFEENMFDLTTDRQVKRDLVVDGIACVENRFHNAKGITLKRVDVKDMVYSKTKDPYFRDCFYKGHYEEVLVSDLLMEFPDLCKSENDHVKQQLVDQSAWWSQYQGYNQSLKGHAHILRFTYRTTRDYYNKIKEKSTGEKIVSKADANFDETELIKKGKKNDFKRVSKVEEVLFEGVMVIGTNILLKWELAKSMARPNSNTQKVCEQYNIIAPNYQDGKIFSLVERMIPIEDLRNIVELKAEQIIQGITPDGIAIDLDAIAEVDLGAGKVNDAQETLNMYLQKGSFFYRSYGQTGDFNNAQKPFMEVKTGDSVGKLTALRNESLNYLTQLTDVIGLNQYSDASNPDKDSLVGIGKLASLNSNLATRHILKGAGYVTLETAKSVLYRIQDILKYYPSLKADLIRKIGATAVEDLESIANLHLSDFALNLHLEQDDEEKAMLDQDLSSAVEAGYITLADKYKVKNIRIFKQAIAYLAIVIEKASKKKEELDANKFKLQADENIRASQEAEKAKQETISLELQAKTAEANIVGEWAIKKEQAKGEQDRLTEEVKGENAINLQYVANEGKVEVADKTEKAKKDNILEQGNIHSRITEQRAKDKDAVDFKAEDEEMNVFEVNE
ncbi:MAG: hypothetical protein WBP82_04830 [Leuconostoc mesenteroides]